MQTKGGLRFGGKARTRGAGVRGAGYCGKHGVKRSVEDTG